MSTTNHPWKSKMMASPPPPPCDPHCQLCMANILGLEILFSYNFICKSYSVDMSSILWWSSIPGALPRGTCALKCHSLQTLFCLISKHHTFVEAKGYAIRMTFVIQEGWPSLVTLLNFDCVLWDQVSDKHNSPLLPRFPNL